MSDMTIFERLDPYLGGELDTEGLVRELLDMDVPNIEYPNVTVRSEIGVDVNELADGILVVYDCSTPTNLGHDLFRFPCSFHVMCSDPDMGAAFKNALYRLILHWPYHNPQASQGGVLSVKPTGFHRVGPDSWNLARDVHVWSLEDVLITARSH